MQGGNCQCQFLAGSPSFRILVARTYREHPTRRGRLTMGTELPAWAGTTVLHREFDFDDRVAPPIQGRRPAATGLPCRTGGALVLPIHDKLGGFEACTFPRLPMIILSGRPEEIHAIALLTADELLGIHIARVHDMHAWQQITLGE